MKRILVLIIAIFLLPIAYAHEEKVVDPGVTPDSFLWGLDKALDNLNLLFSWSTQSKRKECRHYS